MLQMLMIFPCPFSIIPGITALLTMNGAFRSTSTTCRNCAAVISHIGMRFDDARVVHQNVDDAHFLGDLLHHRLHRVLVRYVAHISVGFHARFLVCRKALVHQLLPDVIEYDGRAAFAMPSAMAKPMP